MKTQNKKIIAYIFVAIMLISGFAVLADTVPGQNALSSNPTQPVSPLVPSDISASSGSTVDVYYTVPVNFPTATHDSSSTATNTNTNTACSTSGYPAYPSYPSYPGYPSYPSDSSESWTLDLGSTQLSSGTSSPTDCSHSQSQSQAHHQKETHVTVRGETTYYYYSCSSSYSHSTTTWENSVSPSYTFDSYGSSGGTDCTWTVSIDGTSESGTLDIYSPTVTATASQSSMDIGQTITLGETSSNLQGTYSYSWSESGASGSFSSTTASSPTWTASGTGTASFTLNILDSSGTSIASSSVSVSVDSDPTISVTSNLNPSDSGQSITYDTSVSGGSGTYSSYSYVLYDGTSTSDSELTSGTSSSFSYTYDSTGSYLLDYSVTDSNGYTASTSLTQTVNTDPTVSITTSHNPTDVGISVTFTATGSGGTGGVIYPITLSGVPSGTGYYQQLLSINPSEYGINTAGSNIEFSAANGTLLYAWIQSINSSAMQVWVKNYNGSSVIDMQVFPSSDNLFSANGYLQSYTTPIVTQSSFNSNGLSGTAYYANVSTFGQAMLALNQSTSYRAYINFTNVEFTGQNAYVSGYFWQSDPSAEYYSRMITTSGADNGWLETASTGGILYVNGAGPWIDTGYTLPTSPFYLAVYTNGTNGYYVYVNGVLAYHDNSVTGNNGNLQIGSTTFYADSGNQFFGAVGDIKYSTTQNLTQPTMPTFTIGAGVPVYKYQWYEGGDAISGATSSTYTTPVYSSSGTYDYYVAVTDGADYTVDSSTISETVNSDPVVSASSNVSSADVNYPIEFCATPSGGTGPYSNSWALNGNVISTSQDFSHAFSSPGTYTLTDTLTDSVGETYSASVTVTIHSNPTVTILSSQNPTDSGNSVHFSSSILGGTGTDTYSWTINNVVVSTSSSFYYSFNTTGIFYVNLTVTDSDGHSGFYSMKETVNPDPSVSIKASHNPVDVGIVVNFTAVVTGGTNPDTYSWTINGNNYNTSYVNILFTSPGTYTVTLEITDANGNTASASFSEIVNPDPTVSINAEYNPVDQGVNDTFTAEISGGTGPFNVTWSSGGEILNYSSSFHLKFDTTGSYTVNVSIVDSLGEKAVSSIIIKVIARPSAEIIGNNQTDVGTETYWEAYGSFGTAPYDDYWYINGVNTTSGLYLEYAFPNTGKYNITLLIVDSQGAKAYAYMNVTVNEKPSISVSLSKTTTDTGIPVDISGIVSGGTGPFNVTVSVSGIGIIGYANSMYYEFSPGDYNVTVTVYDSLGNHASATVSIVVHPLPSVSIHAKYQNIDPNTSDVFNATISGGTAPYGLAWYVNGTYEGNQTSISFSFTSPGIYPVQVKITDAESESATSIIDINVATYPVSSIIVSHYNIDSNVSDTFRAQGSGGIGPYSPQFLINGHTFDNSTVSYAFPNPGVYTVELTVSDAFGQDATSYANVTVYSDPTIHVLYNGTPTASKPFHMQANVTGGIAPYSVSWIFSDETLSGFNISHVFSTSGPNTFEVKVTDSSGYTLTKNYTLTVNLYVAITANTTRGLGPLSVAFSSSVLGGSDYSFNWTFSPGHYSLEQNPVYSFPAGNYTVHFSVVSANGAKGYANISIFSLPPPVSISYSTNKNITQYFDFNATANWDAQGHYNMTWCMPNGQNIQGMDIKYKFPVYHEFNTVIATFYYENKTYTETFTVRMVPARPVISFTPPSILPVDTMYSLNATASAPDSNSFTYSYVINGVSYSGQTQLYYFSSTGNYSITVTATDSLGASSSVTKNIDVLPLGKSSSIAISYSKSSNGPEDYYTVKVLSTHGIVSVEAFMSSQTLVISETNSTYTPAGEVAYFNLTMDQRDYSTGTYSISIVAFNNQSQSNHISIPFTVTSQYSSSTVSFGSIISFFGGISNFLITVLTFAGIAIAWASLRREDNPDVTIVEGTGKKTKRIRLQGKKVK